jgi:hypothetical protein
VLDDEVESAESLSQSDSFAYEEVVSVTSEQIVLLLLNDDDDVTRFDAWLKECSIVIGLS